VRRILLPGPAHVWTSVHRDARVPAKRRPSLLGVDFVGAAGLAGRKGTEKRGSVLGAFNLSGAIGILLITWTGGWLFDAIDPRALFVVVGTINVLLFFGSPYASSKAPQRSLASTAGLEGAADG
jgi:MFS family permease